MGYKITRIGSGYYDSPITSTHSVYYFMLDIINNWDLCADIPNTNRGQPKNWIKSDYNSYTKAKKLSYN